VVQPIYKGGRDSSESNSSATSKSLKPVTHHRRRIKRHHSGGFDYITEMNPIKTFRKAEKTYLLENISLKSRNYGQNALG